MLTSLLAIAETLAVYLLTEETIGLKKQRKVLFYTLVMIYECCSVYGAIFRLDNSNNTFRIVLILATVFFYLVYTKGKNMWNIAWFYCNVLIFRSVCQLFKFIFLTIYCQTDMKLIEQYMENMTQTILLFYLLFCLPGFFAAKYIWKQFLLCSPQILKITGLIMLAIYFVADFLDEWVQILTMMPSVLLLFTFVNIWRIGYQNVGEQKLGYYKQLEAQIEETDRELLEIRKEVEKFYIQANEEEHYSKQLLQKIDEIKEIK